MLFSLFLLRDDLVEVLVPVPVLEVGVLDELAVAAAMAVAFIVMLMLMLVCWLLDLKAELLEEVEEERCWSFSLSLSRFSSIIGFDSRTRFPFDSKLEMKLGPFFLIHSFPNNYKVVISIRKYDEQGIIW